MIKEQLEKFREMETPFYYYDLALLRQTLDQLTTAANRYNYKVHYAIKANNNPQLLSIIQQAGIGADCVSGREIELALQHQFSPDDIVFAGVGKTDKEIQFGIQQGISCFNVESLEELTVLGEWAQKLGRSVPIALRINPNIDAQTHRYITTGLDENKFGVPHHQIPEALALLSRHERLVFKGLHIHIGSQITDLAVYKELALKANEWNQYFYDQGFDLPIVNLGGGLGINYTAPDQERIPNFESYFKMFKDYFKPRESQRVHFELGRAIVGQCGSLIARVLYLKEGTTKKFAILDAGMTALLRPALYQSYHKIEKLGGSEKEAMERYDIVGPICESSDDFGEHKMPILQRGDLVAIRSAGAYGEVMASHYNLRQELGYYYSSL